MSFKTGREIHIWGEFWKHPERNPVMVWIMKGIPLEQWFQNFMLWCFGLPQQSHWGTVGCPQWPLLQALPGAATLDCTGSHAAILDCLRSCEIWAPPFWIVWDLTRFRCHHLGSYEISCNPRCWCPAELGGRGYKGTKILISLGTTALEERISSDPFKKMELKLMIFFKGLSRTAPVWHADGPGFSLQHLEVWQDKALDSHLQLV